jgi:hypothetical protein
MSARKQIIIPKENAVFRMDVNGNWHNEHGRFEHPKIIRYFNTSIRKDENGYYVYQSTEDFEEKVYFPYEDTALFVVDIIAGAELLFILNNAEKINPEQGQFFIEQDSLYLETAEHRIKFSSHALVKFSKYIKEEESSLFISFDGRSWPISESVS